MSKYKKIRADKVLKLKASGLSINKIGVIEGITKQRVSQIIHVYEREVQTLERLKRKYK